MIYDLLMGKPVSVICNGQLFDSIKALCERFGADRGKVTRRLNQGWTPEQALDLENRKRKGSTGKPLVYNGNQYSSLVEASQALGLSPATIAARVWRGYSTADALGGNLRPRHGSRLKPIEFQGKTYASHRELCSQYGETWSNVHRRVTRGWTMLQALGIEPPPPRFRNFKGHARDHQWKEVRIAEGKLEPVPDSHGYKLYLITNTVNCKVYVGLTITSLHQRLNQHFSSARSGRKSAFSNAIKKYGEEAFRIELLNSNARTYAELQEQEVKEIAVRDSIVNGYNTARGGSIGSSKEITIAGRTYQSFAEAAHAYGVDPTVFGLRVSRLKWSPEQAAGVVSKEWSGKSVAVLVEGKTFESIRAAAVAYGLKAGTVHSRYRIKGWTIEQAVGIEQPPDTGIPSSKPVMIGGVAYRSIKEAAVILAVDIHALRRRIKLGMSPDDAYKASR